MIPFSFALLLFSCVIDRSIGPGVCVFVVRIDCLCLSLVLWFSRFSNLVVRCCPVTFNIFYPLSSTRETILQHYLNERSSSRHLRVSSVHSFQLRCHHHHVGSIVICPNGPGRAENRHDMRRECQWLTQTFFLCGSSNWAVFLFHIKCTGVFF